MDLFVMCPAVFAGQTSRADTHHEQVFSCAIKVQMAGFGQAEKVQLFNMYKFCFHMHKIPGLLEISRGFW